MVIHLLFFTWHIITHIIRKQSLIIVMEEEYSKKLSRFEDILKKLNPLQVILGEEILKKYIYGVDLLQLSTNEKLAMKKIYKQWCRTHHPDKWDHEMGTNEPSLYVYREYGDAFLKCEENQYDKVWIYMGYAAITFNEIVIGNLSMNEVSRLIRDTDVLIDIIRQCNEIRSETEELVAELNGILGFVKVHLNAKDSGVCTRHSFQTDLILQKDCLHCRCDERNTSTDVIIITASEEGDESDQCDENEGGKQFTDSTDVTFSENLQNDFSGIEPCAAGEINIDQESTDTPDHRTSSAKFQENIGNVNECSDSRAEINGLNIRTLKAIAESMDLSIDNVIEKPELVHMIIKVKEAHDIKYHRKRDNPTKYSIPIETWVNCIRQKVDQLPFDIDGLVVYVLSHDQSHKMKSSKDGRNWSQWSTSSRVNFEGLRRTANCDGGYVCLFKNCNFSQLYNKPNAYYFKRVGGKLVCNVCSVEHHEIKCNCKKIWELEKSSHLVSVYHHGKHNCIAKPFIPLQEAELRHRFSSTPKVTPQQAVTDIIAECFDDPEVDINHINEIIDSSLE